MDNVNNVLSKVMSQLGLDRRLREHTVVSLWPTFVSGAIADRSRPLFIDSERNLVVSVADSATGQELSMLKSRVMSKLGPAARSLGVDIRGLRLDMKYYRTLQNESLAAQTPLVPPPAKPNETDLASVHLTDADLNELAELRKELAANNSQAAEMQTRIIHLFELELRLRRWRQREGFQPCYECGEPAERLHRKEQKHSGAASSWVCITCMYSS